MFFIVQLVNPFWVNIICPTCHAVYPKPVQFVAQIIGTSWCCNAGCQIWHTIPPMQFWGQPVPVPMPQPMPVPIPQPVPQPSPAPLPMPQPNVRPTPTPLPSRTPTTTPRNNNTNISIKLKDGICIEDEDDWLNDDIYVLWATRDGFGNKKTGSTGIIGGPDEGDRFNFGGLDNTIFAGNPGQSLDMCLIVMESEGSNKSQNIRLAWNAASFAASYIPTVGSILSTIISGVQWIFENLDSDDELGKVDIHLDLDRMNAIHNQIQTWHFKGTNNGSDYEYKINWLLKKIVV